MIVGTANETKLYLYIDKLDSSWRRWRFSVDKGDGTVPIWSAAAGRIADASPAFAPHASIFEDKWVFERLAWLLTNPMPPPIKGPGTKIETIHHEEKSVDTASIEVVPDIAPINTALMVQVKVIMGEKVGKGEVVPWLSVDGQSGGSLAETSTDESIASGVLTYEGKITSPGDPGAHRVEVNFSPSGRAAKYIVVQP